MVKKTHHSLARLQVAGVDLHELRFAKAVLQQRLELRKRHVTQAAQRGNRWVWGETTVAPKKWEENTWKIWKRKKLGKKLVEHMGKRIQRMGFCCKRRVMFHHLMFFWMVIACLFSRFLVGVTWVETQQKYYFFFFYNYQLELELFLF